MTDSTGSNRYIMRISRMTVDKLGVRLYDRISAVVAELVANAYDADAENVVVRVPLATLLARKNRATGEVESYGHTIEVEDDGHGMTLQEANAHFLRVGKDRRADPTQGTRSRRKRRPVMGRKGIGKLAPFGICTRIEILSAGGDETDAGYPVSHFVMDYDKILADEDTPIEATYRRPRTRVEEAAPAVHREAHARTQHPPGRDRRAASPDRGACRSEVVILAAASMWSPGSDEARAAPRSPARCPARAAPRALPVP